MAFARINYHSRSLQKAPSVSLVFPDDPEIPRPYSVFYLLHGLSDDDTIWMRRTSIERYVEGCRWSWSCPMEAGASTPTQSSAAPMWRQPMVRTGRPRKPGGGNPTSGVGPQGGEPWHAAKLVLTALEGRFRHACFCCARSNEGASDRSFSPPLRRGGQGGTMKG